MSRSSWREARGQTEPLAALVAVAVVCLALSLYAGYLSDTLPGTSDRTVEETTLDHVWNGLGDDGVYDPASQHPQRIPTRELPNGYHVVIEITVRTDDGHREFVEEAALDPHGGSTVGDPPDDARSASRPIPVVDEERPGHVRSGRLRVVVWQ